MLDHLLTGFASALTFEMMFYMVIGVILGILIGVIPGISSPVGIALLVPFTYAMSPKTSLALLCCLYLACEYGGSISAICINTPGTPMSVATTFDGYPLTKKGMAGKALGTSIIASTLGGFFGILVLILLAAPLANVALSFAPPEYFALGIFGLSIIGGMSGKSLTKGIISVLIGLLIKTVGLDPLTGAVRFTSGYDELEGGIGFMVALIGLFAISEVFVMIEKMQPLEKFKKKISSELVSLREFKSLIKPILLGSTIGTYVGILPGAGATIATFVAYGEAKRFSKHPEKFGTGILEGVAAPESANNASVGGALIPTLTLGVPGSGSTAILLGALMIHGLTPGPLLYVKHPEVIYAVYASLLIGNVLMFIFGFFGTRLWIAVVSCPKQVLAPAILAICTIGAYSLHNSLLEVWLMFGFGVLGYVMHKINFPTAPMVLALVLGYMIETQFRRSLILSNGSYEIFFTRPITVFLLAMAVASIIYTVYRGSEKLKGEEKSET